MKFFSTGRAGKIAKEISRSVNEKDMSFTEKYILSQKNVRTIDRISKPTYDENYWRCVLLDIVKK